MKRIFKRNLAYTTNKSIRTILNKLYSVIEEEKIFNLTKINTKKPFSGKVRPTFFVIRKNFFLSTGVSKIRGDFFINENKTVILLKQRFCWSVNLVFLGFFLVTINFLVSSNYNGNYLTEEILFSATSLLLSIIVFMFVRIYEKRIIVTFIEKLLNLQKTNQ